MRPDEYGIHHGEWREGQEETVEWGYELPGGAGILEMPTGSGKTALPAALSSKHRVVSLTKTKLLQIENYAGTYGFDALFGRGNYDCVYTRAKAGTMADECAFSDDGMHKCPQYGQCPYGQQRETVRASFAASLNYSYWLYAYEKWPDIDYLVCDEAHQLPEIVVQWAGCNLTNKDRINFDLPNFPVLNNRTENMLGDSTLDKALDFLSSCRSVLANEYRTLRNLALEDSSSRRRFRAVERLGMKIAATIGAIHQSSDDWYIKSGPSVGYESGRKTWGFISRPLTARYHFKRYFMRNWQTIAMSATIGNPEVFCKELGISEYNFRTVPSVWPKETRQINVLDVPRLGRSAKDSAWNKQADEIVKAIESVPDEWCGLIHVTSKAESARLADRLARRGLQDRVWTPPKKPTNEQIAAWNEQKEKVPNSIAVSWAMWEGYDGLDEKINIVAKVPFGFLGDEYEKARQRYDGKFYFQRAAWQFEQGLGRTRRGREQDYDTNGEKKGLVACADGSWKWIRKYISEATKEALVEGAI